VRCDGLAGLGRTLLLDLDFGFAYVVLVGPPRLLLKGGAAGFFGIG